MKLWMSVSSILLFSINAFAVSCPQDFVGTYALSSETVQIQLSSSGVLSLSADGQTTSAPVNGVITTQSSPALGASFRCQNSNLIWNEYVTVDGNQSQMGPAQTLSINAQGNLVDMPANEVFVRQ